MYLYLVGFILMVVFTLYYFNYDPFTKKKEKINKKECEPIDTSSIENSINELKSLNQYIDNGTSHRATLP
jgi:hypothetical protein